MRHSEVRNIIRDIDNIDSRLGDLKRIVEDTLTEALDNVDRLEIEVDRLEIENEELKDRIRELENAQ